MQKRQEVFYYCFSKTEIHLFLIWIHLMDTFSKLTLKSLNQSISDQCHISIPPENIIKPLLFYVFIACFQGERGNWPGMD